MNRVSNRWRDSGTPLVNSSSKCLIQTVPVGNDQLPSRLKPMSRLVFGRENQRCLMALSDQKETFKSYGTMPGCGVRVVRSANAPVFVNVAGNCWPAGGLLL